MRPEKEHGQAVHLITLGFNDSEIGRKLSIPRFDGPRLAGWAVGWKRRPQWNVVSRRPATCFQCNGTRLHQRPLRSGPKRYRYTRYMFTNASTDILEIFTDALDLLGIHWTRTTARVVSIARRDDVAFLDEFVGPKS